MGSLRAYQVGTGSLTLKTQNATLRPGHPSAIFTVSSNGTMPGTGILWANFPLSDAWHNIVPGALYAFDAADVSAAPLWSSMASGADSLGNFAKYSPPLVANGKVYVATFSNKLQVYGPK
jgi:outer membrane protein assembly factor BamB